MGLPGALVLESGRIGGLSEALFAPFGLNVIFGYFRFDWDRDFLFDYSRVAEVFKCNWHFMVHLDNWLLLDHLDCPLLVDEWHLVDYFLLVDENILVDCLHDWRLIDVDRGRTCFNLYTRTVFL